MTDRYSFDKKKKLAEKIGKLKTKENVNAIRDIIFSDNPNISVTKKSNSMLLYFHNLNDSTYLKIEKYLMKVDKKRKDEFKRTLSETENAPELSNGQSQTEKTKYKLSNRERNIIKRMEYEKEIDGGNDELTFNSDSLQTTDSPFDVFVKKN